jgi:hypothetical protein
MTITFYCSLGALSLIILLVYRIFSKKEEITKEFKWIYIFLLIIFGGLAYFPLQHYLYPEIDDNSFKNADYHILKQKGFAFDSLLYLVHSQAPNEALWDNKEGEIILTHDSILLKDYYEPFYVETNRDINGNNTYFHLLNSTLKEDVSEGFTLTRNHDTIFSIKIIPYEIKKRKYCHYILQAKGYAPDTSAFKQRINIGYPLNTIIERAPKFNSRYPDSLRLIVEDALLVREYITCNQWGKPLVEKENTSKLYLMPNSSFFTENILFNQNPVKEQSKPFTIFLPDSTMLFYSGLGHTRTDVYSINKGSAKDVRLLYVLPKMQYIRNEDSHSFIASSTDAAVRSDLSSGYLYNLFEESDNVNHIDARFRYFVASSREAMFFETIDLYSDNPAEKHSFQANQEFYLQANNDLAHNNLRWIFEVTDMRGTNTLQWWLFGVFIWGFILLVSIRLWVDACKYPRTLSFLELSVYVMILCFGIVRLILAWRMSTFPPVEDIEAAVFEKMRDSFDIYLYTVIPCCLFPGILIVIDLIRKFIDLIRKLIVIDLIRKFIDLIRKKIKNKLRINTHWFYSFLFVGGSFAFLVLCFFRVIPGSERFTNIVYPVCAYFFFSWLIVREKEKNSEKDQMDFATALIVEWVLTTAYLFCQDTGFTIIFLFFTAVYLCIHYSFATQNKWWLLIIIITMILIGLIVGYQGEILSLLFDNIDWLMSILGFAGIVISLILLLCTLKRDAVLTRIITSIGIVLFIVMLVLKSSIADWINKKEHMRYRIEVQRLAPTESIDELIEETQFESSSMTYIMRAAHNQWFINQYAKSYQTGIADFQIQPHSNQGSSYTTQTTDLVVIRYILAEHGPCLIWILLIILFLLVPIYFYEVRQEKMANRILSGTFLLPFIIGLFVVLSVTNRITFVGQDFPFMSITSRIAVIFPLLLFLIGIWQVMSNKIEGSEGTHGPDIQPYKLWVISLIVAVFSIACWYFIPRQGEHQNEDQFDISEIINNIYEQTKPIDREFARFQRGRSDFGILSGDSIWNLYREYTSREYTSSEFPVDSLNNAFVRSAFIHFDSLSGKVNPSELLHLRRRNGIYRLAVDRKHYLIRSNMQKDLAWTGNILAAQVHRAFSLSEVASNKKEVPINDVGYGLDILSKTPLRTKLSNINITYLDSSWTDKKDPLLLIATTQSQAQKQYYHIQSDSQSLQGNANSSQLATRIVPNDIVVLNIDEDGEDKVIAKWKYIQDSERYIAKNIWLNGKRQLFYPLGKESLWSYHFANLVSQTLSSESNQALKDTTIRVSIDYDLQKRIFDIIDKENRSAHQLSGSTINKIAEFGEMDARQQRTSNKKLGFHYDAKSNSIIIDDQSTINPDIERGIRIINQRIKQSSTGVSLAEAINDVTQRKFAYSAVALDGNGRIRLLFDYNRSGKVDPNNIKYLNRFLSDLYKESNNSTEREILGNSSLQLLNPGPGSSFKPIAYMAITSQDNFEWNTLNVKKDHIRYPHKTPYVIQKKDTLLDYTKIKYYGGASAVKDDGVKSWSLTIDGNGFAHNNYLIHSNNLYHSVMIMLGNQQEGNLMNILKEAGSNESAFPIVEYGGKQYSFDKNKWYENGKIGLERLRNSILSKGLYNNFHLRQGLIEYKDAYSNYFGQNSLFSKLFEYDKSDHRIWAYPETGSQNLADRNLSPFIRNGLIQMALGSSPLEVSPLQIATMGMRIVTLNKEENITSLSDTDQAPEYDLFDIKTGKEQARYLNLYKDVLTQLKNVPINGTASALGRDGLYKDATKGYHIYAKTGTLNQEGNDKNRLKHLLVIISRDDLSTVESFAVLKDAKYYVVYLSYIGIDMDEFDTTNYGKIISAVINSEQFKKYMNSTKKKIEEK